MKYISKKKKVFTIFVSDCGRVRNYLRRPRVGHSQLLDIIIVYLFLMKTFEVVRNDNKYIPLATNIVPPTWKIKTRVSGIISWRRNSVPLRMTQRSNKFDLLKKPFHYPEAQNTWSNLFPKLPIK